MPIVVEVVARLEVPRLLKVVVGLRIGLRNYIDYLGFNEVQVCERGASHFNLSVHYLIIVLDTEAGLIRVNVLTTIEGRSVDSTP